MATARFAGGKSCWNLFFRDYGGVHPSFSTGSTRRIPEHWADAYRAELWSEPGAGDLRGWLVAQRFLSAMAAGQRNRAFP